MKKYSLRLLSAALTLVILCAALTPFAAAQGRIAAGQIAPYPPGVPVVAPGEEIGKKHLAYLSEIGYNMEKEGCPVLCL